MSQEVTPSTSPEAKAIRALRDLVVNGLAADVISEEQAAKMMTLLSKCQIVDDGGSVYPTAATRILAEELNSPPYIPAAEAVCDEKDGDTEF